MCVIIDADVSSIIFRNPPNDNFLPVFEWLFDGDGCLVYGGKLSDQLFKTGTVKRSIIALKKAGRAHLIPTGQVNQEEERVIATGRCRSTNDYHIIALARVSGARTLCSRDRNLRKDFKNHLLISKPRGKLYTDPRSKKDTLCHTRGCPASKDIGKKPKKRNVQKK